MCSELVFVFNQNQCSFSIRISVRFQTESVFVLNQNQCSFSVRIRIERWNRTLKEQAVYGRVFRNLAEVRAAVAEFVERYNQCWRLEKLAYRTPLEAREQYELRHAA